MKPFLIPLVLFTFVLAACSSATAVVPAVEQTQSPAIAVLQTTPTALVASYLGTDYADAANIRNQLAFGILRLEDTEHLVTPDQAQSLLPLWQAVVALSSNETSAAEELAAVQNQIAESLNPTQLAAIAAMQITNTDLNAFYAEYGISFPTPAPGVTREPGSGKNVSQEDREATRAAASALGTPVGTGGSTGQTARTLLFEKVIEMLITRIDQ